MFEQKVAVDNQLINEYFVRNSRKSEDEKWLKENRLAIVEAFSEANINKKDFNDIRVSISVPNESKFDPDKLCTYLQTKFTFNEFLTMVQFKPNEEKVVELINEGRIDLDDVKTHCWIEKMGSPRLTVKKLKKSDLDGE